MVVLEGAITVLILPSSNCRCQVLSHLLLLLKFEVREAVCDVRTQVTKRRWQHERLFSCRLM